MTAMLPRRLAQAAASLPDKPALIERGKTTTFAELLASAQALASDLRPRIEPGARVAAVLENSAAYVASCYATWLAGGLFAGLNTALKEAELLQLIAQCDAAVCIVDAKYRALRDSLNAQRKPVIVAGNIESTNLHANETPFPTAGAAADRAADIADPPPENGALIIFTSGTTGAPKGVLLTHRNLATNTAAIQQYLAIERTDIAMCVLPFFYSYGNSVLHTHLTAGSTLVLENSFMYPQQVIEIMRTQAVTAFYGVPSTYYLLLDRTAITTETLPALRYCAQAGGAMTPARIDAFCDRMTGIRFYVMFGQTEASARVTYLPPDRRSDKSGSVGIAVAGVTLSIRDENGNEMAVGEHGEVCARGDSIMAGYWNDAEETAKVLKNGWLHTGDLGYLDRDGFLFLIGRSREMIKSGAHRIAPREIEDVIAALPGIAEVAVTGTPDAILGEAIVAWVVAQEHSPEFTRQILRKCREELAPYKIPKAVNYLQSLPRTASGKIMKHKLQPGE